MIAAQERASLQLSKLTLHAAVEHRQGIPKMNGIPFALRVTREPGLVIALCDGTSGWDDGQRGSRVAAETIGEAMNDGGIVIDRMRRAMERGGLEMCRRLVGPGGEEFPATCLASLLHVTDGGAHVAWIGDGPAFLVRDGRAQALTRPHLLVDHAIASGQLLPQEAEEFPLKKVIYRHLGGHGPDEPEQWKPDVIGPLLLLPGDRLLLCFHEVTQELELNEVARLVGDGPPEAAVAGVLDAFESRRIWSELVAAIVAVEVPSLR
jgi:PPM family protein phosphatase